MTLTKEQKLERLRLGEYAWHNYLVFCQVMCPKYPDDLAEIRSTAFTVQPHHVLIARAMERVKSGECKRLVITLPPSHGKSEMAVHKFLPWVWGTKPDAKFLVLTYAASLAQDRGREVRKMMLSNEYKLPFGSTKALLSPDSRAMDYLETIGGGKAWFDGLDGTVTGRHAHFIIIDDPLKGSEEARSQTIRDKVWNNFIEVVFTRRQSVDTPIVLITTRWNLDDPAARLVDRKNPYCSNPDEWEVIHLRGCIMTEEDSKNDPLKRKIGEPLWPEKMSYSEYEKMLKGDKVTRNAFYTLYQGDPTPDAGTYFNKEDIIPYTSPEQLPKGLKKYIGSDHAVRTGESNDSTCIIPAGVDSEGDLWVLPDVWWNRKDTAIVVDTMLDYMRTHNPLAWFSGREHITGSIKPFLLRRQREEHTYCPMIEMPDIKDKESKAQPLSGMMSARRIHFPVFTKWWGKALEELMNFPVEGAHNDFVDALANVCRGLHTMINADSQKKKEVPIKGSWAWHQWGRQEKQPIGTTTWI